MATVVVQSKSGTIDSGGTAQTAADANYGRNYLFIQNIDPSEDLWVSFTGTAAVDTEGSFLLAAGNAYTAEGNVVPGNAISVVGATTGNPFTIYEA